MSNDHLNPTHRYPVLSVSLEEARAHARREGRAFDWRSDIEAALRAALPDTKRVQVAVWAREDHGMDALNQPALLTFLYVSARRGGGRIAGSLCRALQGRWGDWAVQLEGDSPPAGGEVRVCELLAADVRGGE